MGESFSATRVIRLSARSRDLQTVRTPKELTPKISFWIPSSYMAVYFSYFSIIRESCMVLRSASRNE